MVRMSRSSFPSAAASARLTPMTKRQNTRATPVRMSSSCSGRGAAAVVLPGDLRGSRSRSRRRGRSPRSKDRSSSVVAILVGRAARGAGAGWPRARPWPRARSATSGVTRSVAAVADAVGVVDDAARAPRDRSARAARRRGPRTSVVRSTTPCSPQGRPDLVVGSERLEHRVVRDVRRDRRAGARSQAAGQRPPSSGRRRSPSPANDAPCSSIDSRIGERVTRAPARRQVGQRTCVSVGAPVVSS